MQFWRVNQTPVNGYSNKIHFMGGLNSLAFSGSKENVSFLSKFVNLYLIDSLSRWLWENHFKAESSNIFMQLKWFFFPQLSSNSQCSSKFNSKTDKKRHIHTQAHDDVSLISHQIGEFWHSKVYTELVLPWLSSQRLRRWSWAGNSWAKPISWLSDSGSSAQLWSWLSTSFNRLSYKLRSELGYNEHIITLSCFLFIKKPNCFE